MSSRMGSAPEDVDVAQRRGTLLGILREREQYEVYCHRF